MVSAMAKLPKYVQEVDGRLYFRRVKLVDGKQKPTRTRLPNLDDPTFSAAYQRLMDDRPRAALVKGTFAELVSVYKGSSSFKQLADNTRRARAYYLALIEARWGAKPYATTPKAKILEWQDELQDTPGKANQLVASLSALFTFAIKRDLMRVNPCLGIDRLNLSERLPWPADVLDDALTRSGAMLRLAIVAHYFTGQRIGDVIAMRRPKAATDLIPVIQEKTGKTVDIPIHAVFWAEIQRVKPLYIVPDMGPLLYGQNGQVFTDDALRDRLRLLMAKMDRDYKFHGLRKNAVIALLEVGCSTWEAAAITGQSQEMVEYYAKEVNRKKLARSAILKWEQRGTGL